MRNENELIFEAYSKTRIITEGEYADDEIDRGMMSDRPYGPTRRKTSKTQYNSKPPLQMVTTPASVSDDEFTWWHDALMSTPGAEKMSPYEIASMAWHEAVKRMESAQ